MLLPCTAAAAHTDLLLLSSLGVMPHATYASCMHRCGRAYRPLVHADGCSEYSLPAAMTSTAVSLLSPVVVVVVVVVVVIVVEKERVTKISAA